MAAKHFLKENFWQLLTIVLGGLLILSLFTSSGSLGGVSKETAANNAINYINNELLDGQAVALLSEVKEEGNLYKVTISLGNEQIDSYVTKDGNLFFPQGIELTDSLGSVQAPSGGAIGGTTGTVTRANVDAGDSPSKGDDKAEVTIIEFSDFECSFCRRFYQQTLPQIESTYIDTGKVKFVYKHFPLSNIHSEAENAGLASECANEQGKFWEYHDLIFDNQQLLSSTIYSQWASQLSLDVNKFDECFNSRKYIDKVQDDFSLGSANGISGTPGFLVNGRLLSGAQPFSAFQQVIEEELGNREITGNTVANVPAAGAGCGVPSGGSAPTGAAVVAPIVDVSEDNDPFLGDENAPVVIVSFEDYECPFCKRSFDQVLPQLKTEYIDTGKVKYVYRDFPLSFHPNAQKAAESAECAGDQGKYWEMHEVIFNNQQAISVNDLKTYATQLGLDSNTFNSCLDSGEKTSEVQNDFNEGQNYDVSGTPTFFINGKRLVGAQPYSSFKSLIDQELN
tara:strand:- start:63 stop:1589 length:1527 start_codon:yes stop_codon:yes gene_type:complete